MKILITGATGQVGHALTQRLASLGDVIAVDRHGADLGKSDSLVAVLDSYQPDWIINAAAYTAVDKAESEPVLANEINAKAPGVMAVWAEKHGAKLVHYSTDYVFDGQLDEPYKEDAATAPLNVYGATKLAGEQAILATKAQAWVFRTTWVFATHGANFLKTMLKLGQERDALSVVNDQVGAPTSASWIAEVTARLMEVENAPAPGVYHLAAAGSTHWLGYAQFVLSEAQRLGMPLKVNSEQVVGIPSSAYPTPAQRPMNSRLNSDTLMRALGISAPDWRKDVAQVTAELVGQAKSLSKVV